jgi:hypothetical protein
MATQANEQPRSSGSDGDALDGLDWHAILGPARIGRAQRRRGARYSAGINYGRGDPRNIAGEWLMPETTSFCGQQGRHRRAPGRRRRPIRRRGSQRVTSSRGDPDEPPDEAEDHLAAFAIRAVRTEDGPLLQPRLRQLDPDRSGRVPEPGRTSTRRGMPAVFDDEEPPLAV